MSPNDRRAVREQLFGIGHTDLSRSIGGRSPSGAVVSTAPHGTRAGHPKSRSPRGSYAKMGVGLLLALAVGAVAWAFLAPTDSPEVATTTIPASTTTSPPSTTTATTVPVAERTGVTDAEPIVLPAELLSVDTARRTPPTPGSSALLLRAPDGTVLWMAEVDGPPSSSDNLVIETVGALEVGTDANWSEGDLASYQPQVACGFVLLNDAPGEVLYRTEVVQLLESTSIDGDGNIDMLLPSEWSVIDVGGSVETFTTTFQVPVGDDGTAIVSVVQAPGGSIAQLAFGGRQLGTTTFLGEDAFIDIAPAVEGLTSLFWIDNDTVFHVSSSDLGIAELESFVDRLQPVPVGEWDRRFDTEPAAPEESAATATDCTPQPKFGTTLDP